MKTLVFNGSPRKNGNTAHLIEQLRERLGGESTVIQADGSIAPCKDCRRCYFKPGCAIHDGMEKVWKALSEADLVVLAFPVYFNQPCGQLLTLATRFQYAYVSRYIRKDPSFSLGKRKGAVLLTAGGSTKDIDPAVDTAREILKLCGADISGVACALHTDKIPAWEDLDAREQVRKLAAILKLSESES